MHKDKPGIEFEKIVAKIQSQIAPESSVKHNQQIIDRHGHSRQFDVAIRGKFAGQDMLGVIECKDLKKKVGTPEIDAFVTKSQDINANFKIVVSRNGFTKTAIQKAKHYGIQTLSLIPEDEVNARFKVGNYWFADIYYWEVVSIDLDYVDVTKDKIKCNVQDIRLKGKKVIDWFTNYLNSNHSNEEKVGWVVGLVCEFENNQVIQLCNDRECLCSGIRFYAKRALAKKQKFVGINGRGFFNWQENEFTFPSQTEIRSDSVQTDFMEWDDRDSDDFKDSGFINVKIVGHNSQFEFIEDAIDLNSF